MGLIRDLNELVINDFNANVYDEYALKLLNRIEDLRGVFFNDVENPSIVSYLDKINELSKIYVDAYILKEIVPLTNCYQSLILKEVNWFENETYSDYILMNLSFEDRRLSTKRYGKGTLGDLIKIKDNSVLYLRLIKMVLFDFKFNKDIGSKTKYVTLLNIFFKYIIMDFKKNSLLSNNVSSEYASLMNELEDILSYKDLKEVDERLFIIES